MTREEDYEDDSYETDNFENSNGDNNSLEKGGGNASRKTLDIASASSPKH